MSYFKVKERFDNIAVPEIGLVLEFKIEMPNMRWTISSSLGESIEPRHEISNSVICGTSKGSDQPAHTRSLIRAFASRLNILLLLGY